MARELGVVELFWSEDVHRLFFDKEGRLRVNLGEHLERVRRRGGAP